jgi:hypothetical protein
MKPDALESSMESFMAAIIIITPQNKMDAVGHFNKELRQDTKKHRQC